MSSGKSDSGQSGTSPSPGSPYTNTGPAASREAQVNQEMDTLSGGEHRTKEQAETSGMSDQAIDRSYVDVDRMRESISVQEEAHESLAEICTGVEQPGAMTSHGSMHHAKLPSDLEKDLEEETEHFKSDALAKMNEAVCSQPGLNPLLSVAEASSSGERAVQLFMTIFTLALHSMTRQVNTMKQCYRRVLDEQKGDHDRIENIRQELANAEAELQQLREEKSDLMQQLSNQEEKQRAVNDQDQRPGALDPGSPPSSLAQHTQGYVRVEKQQTTEDGDVKLRTEEASQRESELERKIAKLKSTQKQLVEANTEWEKHCRDLTESHDKQVKSLSEELRETQRRFKDQRDKLKECEKQIADLQIQLSELERQEQLKWMKQMEDMKHDFEEKLALKEAAYQSLRERHHDDVSPVMLQPIATGYQSNEDKSGLERRVRELELQVKELRQERAVHQQQQQAPALNLNTENKQQTPSSPPRGHSERHSERHTERKGHSDRSSSEQRNAQIKQYKTQIGVLQAQITAFKEDFDNERADRERAQAEKDELRLRFTTEVAELKRLIEQKDRESAAVRNQNEFVRQQYTQKCRELETEKARNKELDAKTARLQSQVRQYQEYYERSQFTHGHTNPPLDVHISRPPPGSGGLKWRCPHCTYDNIHQRVTCEMCGKKGPHITSMGSMVPDTPRLLARSVDQADGTSRPAFRNQPNSRGSFYARDVEQDTQFLTEMN